MQEGFKRNAIVEVFWSSKRARSSVRSSGFLYIRALRSISKGDKLFMDYGEDHPINDDKYPETMSDMEDETGTAGPSAADEEEERGDK